jgi:LPXTG-motif cell wall-anchored protein
MYTARNDQYAFATTLVEALTGQLPDVDVDGQLRTLAAPQLPPAVAERLTEVLRRGRHPRAEARYPTCRDLGQAVAAAIESPRALPVRFSLSDSQRDTTEESAPLRPSLPPESGGANAKEVAQTRRTQNIIVGLALLVLIGLFLWRRKERVRVESLATPSATATQSAP